MSLLFLPYKLCGGFPLSRSHFLLSLLFCLRERANLNGLCVRPALERLEMVGTPDKYANRVAVAGFACPSLPVFASRIRIRGHRVSLRVLLGDRFFLPVQGELCPLNLAQCPPQPMVVNPNTNRIEKCPVLNRILPCGVFVLSALMVLSVLLASVRF